MTRLCNIEGCGRPYKARGLCNTHDARRRKGAPLDPPIKPRPASSRCTFEGCESKHYARGLCRLHYRRKQEGTPLEAPLKLRCDGPMIERLWFRTVRTDTCWLWVGSKDQKGYGGVWADGKLRKVHRVAYELLVGPIPDGLELDHLCAVRNCWNPDHLDPVTGAENMRRARERRKAAVLNRSVGDLLD